MPLWSTPEFVVNVVGRRLLHNGVDVRSIFECCSQQHSAIISGRLLYRTSLVVDEVVDVQDSGKV